MDTNTQKRTVFARMLDTGAIVQVHLDPSISGTILPWYLRDKVSIMLEFGYDMPIPIPDLVMGEHSVQATLSFKGAPYSVRIPWEAVYCLSFQDRAGRVWEQDVPGTLLKQARMRSVMKVVHHNPYAIRTPAKGKLRAVS